MVAVPAKANAATAVGSTVAAERVAADLRKDDHAIVDGLLPSTAAAALGDCLRSMHEAGELRNAELHTRLDAGELHDVGQRGDLLAWVMAAEQDPPPAVRVLLDALDELVWAMAEQPPVADALFSLRRGDAQCTVYPGGGSRYVRHIDEEADGPRKLTCIFYVNPGWSPAAGGELRLHLAEVDDTGKKRYGRRFEKDIAPLHGRLVLFWADMRVPHEVLPTHLPRYAVSVWYEDGSRRGATAGEAS